MRIGLAALGFAGAILLASPAAAQEFRDWKSGNWEVYHYKERCWVIYSRGEHDELSVAVSSNSPSFFIAAQNPAWQSWIVAEKAYDVHFQFGSAASYDSVGHGTKDRAGVGVILRKPSREVMPDFEAATSLSFQTNGVSYETALDPTARAQFVACVASMGGPGS